VSDAVAWISLCGTHLEAQTGPNAVFNSSGACSSSSYCTPSTAFIDASVFVSQATTFCGILNYMLTPSNGIIPSSGAVIDARGLNSTNTSMTCTSSPWAGISSPPPSTILVPATGGGTNLAPIVIPSGWVLPANTHLIGVADGDVATQRAIAIQAPRFRRARRLNLAVHPLSLVPAPCFPCTARLLRRVNRKLELRRTRRLCLGLSVGNQSEQLSIVLQIYKFVWLSSSKRPSGVLPCTLVKDPNR
jgi:hypothetical protein